jgi:hypothetical protein
MEKFPEVAIAAYPVRVGDGESTDDLLQANEMTFDKRITQARYPIHPRESQASLVELVPMEEAFTFDEGLAALMAVGLSAPSHEYCFRFFVAYSPMLTEADSVIFLCRYDPGCRGCDSAFVVNGTDDHFTDAELELLEFDVTHKFPAGSLLAGIRGIATAAPVDRDRITF